MKVVYKKRISERILELYHEATLQCKEIDFIEITKQEAIELYNEIYQSRAIWEIPLYKLHIAYVEEDKLTYVHNSLVYGIRIKVEGR